MESLLEQPSFWFVVVCCSYVVYSLLYLRLANNTLHCVVVFAVAIYIKNTWSRIKAEMTRRKQKNFDKKAPWLFPSLSWIRYSFFSLSCFYLMWMLYFNLIPFVVIGYILLSITGWLECTIQASTFLAINYAMKAKNPKGYTFISIFSIMIITNCVIFFLYKDYNDKYDLFCVIHWSIYIFVEICIASQYQLAASKLVCNTAAASTGFNEFKDMFVRPFFRFIYQTFNIVIIGFVFLFTAIFGLNDNKICYKWILPCIVSLRIYFLHLQSKPSRPNLCNGFNTKCWFPFVDKFYQHTVTKYGDMDRNTDVNLENV